MKKLHSELSVIYSNALAMLSIEKNLVRDSIDFNPNVIDMFAKLKNRRAKFFLSSSRASMNFLKIASQACILYLTVSKYIT